MSGWAGLAAGANMYAQMKMQDKKDELLDKLEKDREARADARQIAEEQRAEARAAKRVASTETVQVGGKYVTQYKNANGDVIKSEDADPDTIEKVNNTKLQTKLTLENLQNEHDLGVKKLGSYDSDHALDTRYREAQIGETNRHYDPNYDGASSRTYKPETYSAPSKDSLEAALGVVTDDAGHTHVDPVENARYAKWRTERQIPNGAQSLDAYVAERDGRKKAIGKYVAAGVPAPIAGDVMDSVSNGGTYNVPASNLKLSPADEKSRDEGLVLYKRALYGISQGSLTKEEAKAQLRKHHFPKLAEKIK